MLNQSLRFLANSAMLFTAFIWGMAFIGQNAGLKTMAPMEFTAARFLMGAVALTPLLWRYKTELKSCLKPGAILGLFLALGAGLQQQALLYTSVGNTAFITGLYAIFIPILGFFIGRPPNNWTFFACGLAVIGLYLISIQGEFRVHYGDFLVVLCALAFSIQVLCVDNFAKRFPPIVLAVMQFYICALLCGLYSVIFEEPSLSHIKPTLGPLLYTGLVSVAIAYTLQVIVQKYVNPTHAALILSMETVFGWTAGALILNEVITSRSLWGCILMLAAMVISILANRDLDAEPVR